MDGREQDAAEAMLQKNKSVQRDKGNVSKARGLDIEK